MTDIKNMSDFEVLTRTLWGETGGRDCEEMEAVALVALNRFRSGKWWGGYEIREDRKYPSLRKTCWQTAQFSCWKKKHPAYEKITSACGEDECFAKARQIAKRAIEGKLTDFINGAYFYHSRQNKPKWAKHHSPCYETAQYLFYNDI